MIIKTYEMTDLCDWIKVLHIYTPSSEDMMHVVAEIKRYLWFHGQLHFCLLAPITLSIFVQFSKMRCQNLSLGELSI